MKRGSIKVIVVGVLLSTVASWALAQSPSQFGDTGREAPLREVSAVNTPLLSDPAGSLGAQGTRLGLGATVHHRSAVMGAMIEDQRSDGPSASPGRIAVPRFWLSQGLPIPMNLVLSAGAAPELGISQVTGALQGTLWEAFGWPAVAVRLSDSRLFGPRETRLITRAVSVVTDWVPWSPVTFFGSYGWVRHGGSWRSPSQGDLPIEQRPEESPSPAPPSLANAPEDSAKVPGTGAYEEWAEWGERVASLGVRWRWAPLISISGEMGWRGAQLDQWAVKWAVGL